MRNFTTWKANVQKFDRRFLRPGSILASIRLADDDEENVSIVFVQSRHRCRAAVDGQ